MPDIIKIRQISLKILFPDRVLRYQHLIFCVVSTGECLNLASRLRLHKLPPAAEITLTGGRSIRLSAT